MLLDMATPSTLHLWVQPSSLKGKWSTTRYTNDKLTLINIGDVKALSGPQECTNGLYQELADLALRCGQSQAAQNLFNGCQQNPMGVYCGIATGEKIPAILAACRGSNCTPQCRNLLMNIRNELGCCINVILNDTSDQYYTPLLLIIHYGHPVELSQYQMTARVL